MGVLDKIIEVSVNAKEAVKKMGDYMEKFCLVALGECVEVFQGLNLFLLEFSDEVV